MKWVIIFALVLLAACSKTKQSEVGQFVYVDCFNTIHIDREYASRLADNPKTKEERMANMQGVTFVDTCDLTGYARKFCPRCIDDGAYEQLSEIMERNENKPPAY